MFLQDGILDTGERKDKNYKCQYMLLKAYIAVHKQSIVTAQFSSKQLLGETGAQWVIKIMENGYLFEVVCENEPEIIKKRGKSGSFCGVVSWLLSEIHSLLICISDIKDNKYICLSYYYLIYPGYS